MVIRMYPRTSTSIGTSESHDGITGLTFDGSNRVILQFNSHEETKNQNESMSATVNAAICYVAFLAQRKLRGKISL